VTRRIDHAGDDRAAETKGRRFYEDGRRGERPWYCRACGREELAEGVPVGWYRLERKGLAVVARQSSYLRLGLYCSVRCLARMVPRLMGVEDDLGDDWAALAGAEGQFQGRPRPGR